MAMRPLEKLPTIRAKLGSVIVFAVAVTLIVIVVVGLASRHFVVHGDDVRVMAADLEDSFRRNACGSSCTRWSCRRIPIGRNSIRRGLTSTSVRSCAATSSGIYRSDKGGST